MSDHDRYAVALAFGSAYLAQLLIVREDDLDRAHRKRKVLKEKVELLRDAFPEHAEGKTIKLEAVLKSLKLDDERARTLLVDLSFGDAFAPYELETDDEDVRRSLGTVARALAVDTSFITRLYETRDQAESAHRMKITGRHVAFGVLGGALFAAGGWMFAPALGASLGAAAGLSGAAATNFGLALLGGGSLAAGGAGVAGGMAVVTGIAAGVGAVGATGASVLHSLGAQGAKQELIKLQTTYKAVLLLSQKDRAKAKRVVTDLASQLKTLQKDLKHEREINDKNAQRVKELEKTITHVENTLKWMKSQAA